MVVYIPSDPTRHERAKRSKYKNTKCAAMGRKFDSCGERDRYFYLQDHERAGRIRNLRCQVRFDLGVCAYIADFTYEYKASRFTPAGPVPKWIPIVEDFKGGYKLPADFRIKQKMMAERGTPITIVKSPTAPVGGAP